MITCDFCPSEELPRPSSCARCAQPQCEPKHPGVLRVILGSVAFFGGAGAFDQTPLMAAAHDAELMQSLQLIWTGAFFCLWGTHRIQRGPTVAALHGSLSLYVAKRVLRRMGRVV